jgi:hypothetical protein
MSVEISGRPSGEGGGPEVPDGSGPAGASDAAAADAAETTAATRNRPSALQRVAGGIPEGTQVDQSLDQFIDQVHSSLVHARGWTLTEEEAAREREEAAREREDARVAALTAAEVAAAAAERARATAVADAARARDDERRTSQRMAVLEARLADAEARAAAAEERASDASPDEPGTATMRHPRRRGQVVLSCSIAFVGLAVTSVLWWRGWSGADDGDRGPPPAQAKAASRPEPPAAPEPVVRSLMPAEPAVRPLDEVRAPPARPARARPAGAKAARKPARRPTTAP